MNHNYVKKEDIPVLMEMFDENLGEGYMTEEQILHYITDTKELFYAARREDGTLCGILLFGEESAETLSAQTKVPAEKLLHMTNGKKLLKCRSMCIAKDCQKNGVGRELFNTALKDIKARKKYGLITSLLWEYNGIVPAEKLHIDNGFQFLYRIKMPWYGYENYYCVVCKGRCRCDGLQYILKLSEE